jgi:hypothetical protein
MHSKLIIKSNILVCASAYNLFEKDWQIIQVNRTSGDHQFDIQDTETLENVFKSVGGFDSLISASG